MRCASPPFCASRSCCKMPSWCLASAYQRVRRSFHSAKDCLNLRSSSSSFFSSANTSGSNSLARSANACWMRFSAPLCCICNVHACWRLCFSWRVSLVTSASKSCKSRLDCTTCSRRGTADASSCTNLRRRGGSGGSSRGRSSSDAASSESSDNPTCSTFGSGALGAEAGSAGAGSAGAGAARARRRFTWLSSSAANFEAPAGGRSALPMSARKARRKPSPAPSPPPLGASVAVGAFEEASSPCKAARASACAMFVRSYHSPAEPRCNPPALARPWVPMA
mmetsp:Transcript_30165/g.99799  ORF Transcript_30165/g.99799 Transcript_30165/m.99799 type:complete len:280 (+) Transcript_30165:2184-3023(+)